MSWNCGTRVDRVVAGVVGVVLSLLASTASADFVEWSTVTQVDVFEQQNVGRVYVSAADVNPADCATGGRYSFDLSTDAGRAGFRTALAAFLAGREVKLSIKKGTCNGYFPAIDVIYMR